MNKLPEKSPDKSESVVRARIRCEVEIDVGQWGGNADFNALFAQAKREGINALEKMIQPNRGVIAGTPTIVFVVAEKRG